MDEKARNHILKVELMELVPKNWRNVKNVIRTYRFSNEDLKHLIQKFREFEVNRRKLITKSPTSEQAFLSLLNV